MSEELQDAITEATEEAVKEAGGPEEESEEVAAEEASVEAAAEEEKPEAESKAEEKAEEEEEEPLGLSAAELKAINDDPKLLAVYKSMQRGMTKKAQSFSETRKQYEESARMIDYIRANPDAAIEEMARARGYILAKKEGGDAAKSEAAASASDAVDALMEKYSSQLGPESTKLLLPFMREVAQAVVQQTVAPIAERTQFLDRSAKERGISAAVHEFGSSVKEQGEEWTEEIQADMAKLMDRVVPGDNATIQDYLSTVYNAVVSERGRRAALKSELSRLRKAAAEAEPTRSVRPAPKVRESITDDMSERDAIALATRLAEEELRSA